MAAFPHSVSTGRYTIGQLEGEDCALCGRWFGLCPWPRPVKHELIDGDQTYRHVDECPKAGASKC